MRPHIKICCIRSQTEAKLAIRYGATALGLVSAMPSGPGVISEEDIADIAQSVPPPIATFLLTSLQDPLSIIAQQRRCRANTLQLCDSLPRGAHTQIRAALPGISLVQVIHVEGETSLQEALEVEPFVDALLLDSGRPNASLKELGGTGRVHDWDWSRRIRDAVSVPLFLAGGLNALNVREALARVAPHGLDLCSSVRTEGALDEAKLSAFCAAAFETPKSKIARK